MAEVRSAIQMLQNSQDRMGIRITETEQHISKIEDDREAENQRVQQLEQRIAAAAERIDELENRSRRNNIRIIGFPEGVEESNLIAFLQKALPGLLGLESEANLEMERAHRALGPRPAQGQHPRAFIVKLFKISHSGVSPLGSQTQGPSDVAGTENFSVSRPVPGPPDEETVILGRQEDPTGEEN
nr:PREDICTED: uncharacterized protein LOC106705180 [Latimeria chalumnae]|eukprot:XP_014349403.1 PREDICTED: uncharacterized protein LOC106705180 [Latimeria chalumnae]